MVQTATVEYSKLTQVADWAYVTDASDIAFVGRWPKVIEVWDNGLRVAWFRRDKASYDVEGDLLSVSYVTKTGASLLVFND